MSKLAWLTPNSLPYGYRCRSISIPNSAEWESLLVGAILSLAEHGNYEVFGSMTEDEVADIFHDALLDMINGGGCCRETYSDRVVSLPDAIVHWGLDETSGFYIYDDVQSANTGFVLSAQWGKPGIGDGHTALGFNTETLAQILPSYIQPVWDGNLFTVAFWLRPDTIDLWDDGEAYGIWSCYKDNNIVRMYKSSTDDRLVFERIQGGATVTVHYDLPRRTDWYIPVACVLDRSANRHELYVGGHLVASDSTSQNEWTETTHTWLLGAAQGSGAAYWLGSIDHLTVYNGALDSEQIRSFSEVI
jgi:hypothetical protein